MYIFVFSMDFLGGKKKKVSGFVTTFLLSFLYFDGVALDALNDGCSPADSWSLFDKAHIH